MNPPPNLTPAAITDRVRRDARPQSSTALLQWMPGMMEAAWMTTPEVSTGLTVSIDEMFPEVGPVGFRRDSLYQGAIVIADLTVSSANTSPPQPSAPPGTLAAATAPIRYPWDMVASPAQAGLSTYRIAVSPSGEELANSMRQLFVSGRMETFDDGIESLFGQTLAGLLSTSGERAMIEAEQLIFSPLTEPDVAVEALKVIARSKEFLSAGHRRRVAEAALSHMHFAVRDAAVVALSIIGDGDAVPALRAAARHEQVPEIQKQMRQVIEDLRAV